MISLRHSAVLAAVAVAGVTSLAVAGSSLIATPAKAQAAAPAADRGATLFRQRCAVCHTVTAGARSTQGPNLNGVVGRRSASVAGYNYSTGMKAANLTWNATTLDGFLSGPSRTVRGTRMMASVTNPADRAAIIGYLATQRPR